MSQVSPKLFLLQLLSSNLRTRKVLVLLPHQLIHQVILYLIHHLIFSVILYLIFLRLKVSFLDRLLIRNTTTLLPGLYILLDVLPSGGDSESCSLSVYVMIFSTIVMNAVKSESSGRQIKRFASQ